MRIDLRDLVRAHHATLTTQPSLCRLWVESGRYVFVLGWLQQKGSLMAPRPPNYSQERIQRERKKRAKAEEKAERNAEKAARRRAARGEETAPSDLGDSKPG